jgi:PTS system nitrogen regulatory IIA component
MDIGDFLSPKDAILDIRAPDKRLLLKELCARAAAALKLDGEQISSEILKREELGSTGVGDGVAMPHARVQGLKTPFGILARLQRPMDFDAIDGQPVDIVFLLLLPAVPAGERLNALASVARRLRNPDAVRALRGAPDKAALHRAMVTSSP